ncbi:MAG: DUF1622 domain-containing protein [Ktedonobacterales bacterium]
MTTKQVAELVASVLDLAGIAALVIGTIVAVVLSGRILLQARDASQAYVGLRQGLGKAILMGLELLVASDIIRTVAIEPTFESVGVLGLIILIRTFLSWSLELEITGRWPWQSSRTSHESV